MIFELMSNGTLAKLPPEFMPDGILNPEDEDSLEHREVPFVLLLLPHNRYILGQASASGDERWVWGKPGTAAKNIFLYDNEKLKLTVPGSYSRDEATSIEVPAEAVTFLKRELFRQVEPPGNHRATALFMRSFMPSHMAFVDDFMLQDEAAFMQAVNDDKILYKIYWTLRFAMMRGESEIVTRLRAWLKAGPEVFDEAGHMGTDSDHSAQKMRIWFSLMSLPDESVIKELEMLSFSREDLNHMVRQQVSPLLLFNPRSGYLVLMKMAQQPNDFNNEDTGFRVWAYIPPNSWTNLRERCKLTVREIMMALWGEHDIEQALELRSRYAQSAPVAS